MSLLHLRNSRCNPKGGDGKNTLIGGAGTDMLTGGAKADTLTGGAGIDTFVGSGGADIIDDFVEDDVISVATVSLVR